MYEIFYRLHVACEKCLDAGDDARLASARDMELVLCYGPVLGAVSLSAQGAPASRILQSAPSHADLER